MVDKNGKQIYESWLFANSPMTFRWDDRNFQIIAETADGDRHEFPVHRDRMSYWGIPAYQIILGHGGQIMFKVEDD